MGSLVMSLVHEWLVEEWLETPGAGRRSHLCELSNKAIGCEWPLFNQSAEMLPVSNISSSYSVGMQAIRRD